MPAPFPEQPTFDKQRHIKYLLRCLKTLLPRAYMSNDSNRMTLGFFIISGLDLVGALNTTTSESERAGHANWIYHCQLPTGGFRGFPGTDFGGHKSRTVENECWDPANLPATFFALTTLLVLGDDLTRVKRGECLLWLRRMQRADGSFGEVLGSDGKIEGSRDLRFCCCAAGIRYILRGEDSECEDIDVQRLVSYVKSCQSYDGGFAEAPGNESHAGLTYCALGAFSFLGITPEEIRSPQESSRGPATRCDDLVGWLACRQTTQIYENEDNMSEDKTGDSQSATQAQAQDGTSSSLSPEERIPSLPILPEASQLPPELLNWAGFNGRLNKIADTCYCFWVTGSLGMLDHLNLVNVEANRKFLLQKTQHMIGGFGKCVGEPPDLLHSYLGLASLGLLGDSDIEEVDPTFCTSKRARRHLESLPWWRSKGQA